MNFGDLVQAVLSDCKRPDKLSKIRSEINQALLFAVTDINGTRDSTEESLTLVGTEYTQAVDMTLLTRFRKFQYVKRGGTFCYLTELFVNQVVGKKVNMADKYYIMGTSLKVSLAELASSLDVCYYQYPPVLTETLGNNEHWLLESAWSFIYNRAMARVYASIDDNSNADKYESYAQEFWRTKRMDLQAEGTQ